MSERPLTGKVALVTGAGRGIGRAIALAYADAGAKVVCAARTRSEIEEVAGVICERGGEAIACVTDAAKEEDAQRLARATEAAFGGLDILFLNAGIAGGFGKGRFAEVKIEEWREVFEVNVYSALLVARAALPLLRKSDAGMIFTMGSGMGRKPDVGTSAYSCSKAALWMLTQAMALELAGENIVVNELIPGPVNAAVNEGDDWEGVLIEEGHFKDEFRKHTRDIGPLAVFMATQAKYGPTGQSFSLNRRLL